MKLFCEITSERGKEVTKSGNEYIAMSINNETRDILAEISTKVKEKWLDNPKIVIAYNSHIVDIVLHDMAEESSDFWGISEKTKEEKQKMDNWKPKTAIEDECNKGNAKSCPIHFVHR